MPFHPSTQLEKEPIWKVSMSFCPVGVLPILEEVLYAHAAEDFPTVCDFEIPNDPQNRLLEGYYIKKPNLEVLNSSLKNMMQITGDKTPNFILERLENKNWVAESQKILKPIDAGRFYIYGGHDTDKIPKNKIPILMEAGQAFGTGSHETTQGCLLAISDLMDHKAPKVSLDLGCGSALLAIAIAKLWQTKVIATDIDPIAVQTSIDNVFSNNLSIIDPTDRKFGVAALLSDGFNNTVIQKIGPYDLIVANILAAPLQELAEDIVKNLKKEGYLILSGLLISQEDVVLKSYEKHRMVLVKKYPINEWSSLVLRKL
jgi:ribosomal protein L11 methyltransferase